MARRLPSGNRPYCHNANTIYYTRCLERLPACLTSLRGLRRLKYTKCCNSSLLKIAHPTSRTTTQPHSLFGRRRRGPRFGVAFALDAAPSSVCIAHRSREGCTFACVQAYVRARGVVHTGFTANPRSRARVPSKYNTSARCPFCIRPVGLAWPGQHSIACLSLYPPLSLARLARRNKAQIKYLSYFEIYTPPQSRQLRAYLYSARHAAEKNTTRERKMRIVRRET